MSEVAKRILEKIKEDTAGTDINLFPERLERWEMIIDYELARDATFKAMENPKNLGTEGKVTCTRDELHERGLESEARRQSRLERDNPTEWK